MLLNTGPAARSRLRARFQAWRWQRPFWGGLLTLASAVVLYGATAVPMGLAVLQGVTVLGTIVLSITLLILGLATWFQPLLRTITGPVVVLLAVVSLLVSNFGGFGIGMFLAMAGGGLMFAWSPDRGRPDVVTKEAEEVREAGEARETRREAREAREAQAQEDQAEEVQETVPVPVRPAVAPAPRNHRPAWRPPTLLWLAVVGIGLTLGLLLAGPGLTAVPAEAMTARSRTAAEPADLPCLLPFLCPAPAPTPTPNPLCLLPFLCPAPTPTPSPGEGLFPWLNPPTPAKPVPAKPAATCDPSSYPTQAQKPTGATARKAASVLASCARSGKPAAASPAAGTPMVSLRPGSMKASKLTLDNLKYEGTASLNTARGSVTVMEFSASKVTVADMKLTIPSGAATLELRGTNGVATISGHVRLYALDLSGDVLGLLPLKFTPNPPPLLPPIAIPSLFFTGVTSTIALVTADAISAGSVVSVR